MNNRRIVMILGLLAVLALLVVIVLKLTGSKTGEESEEIAADMAVHVGTISRATLHQAVLAYGTIEPEPAAPGRSPAEAEVASPVAGILAHIDCSEGQKVAQGTLLFRLDSRIADVTYEKAKKTITFAAENFARKKKLLAIEGTSQKDYQEAEQQLNTAHSELAAAETDQALLRITAPLAGTVVKINSKPGESVELNTVLAKIIDLGRLIAAVSVPSSETAPLKVGQAARIEPDITGVVVFVGAHIDLQTDTMPVRISVPAHAGFHPGQFVSVRIVCAEHPSCLAVPEAAVISDFAGGDSGFLVLVDGDKAVRKPIKIGLRESGLVEVTGEGLKEGQTIVTEDAYAVPDATKIHIIK